MGRLTLSWNLGAWRSPLRAVVLGLALAAGGGARAAECGNDADEDGFLDRDCQTGERIDCDDASATVHPGATEVPYDGIDQDCDGRDFCDVDGDGYAATACTSLDGGGNPVSGTDCDDTNAAIHPFATEIADDGIDQDCSGADAGLDCDLDEDGFDARACGGLDCNDVDPAIHPGAQEIEADGIDQDCNGQDDCEGVAWVQGGLACHVLPASGDAGRSGLPLTAGLLALAALRYARARRMR